MGVQKELLIGKIMQDIWLVGTYNLLAALQIEV
jgi:hypothetical protein